MSLIEDLMRRSRDVERPFLKGDGQSLSLAAVAAEPPEGYE